MLVLGIESTCDETAFAIVQDGKTILANVISSQIDLHKEYGGVVPELACRRHIDVWIPVFQKTLSEANVKLEQIDLIAVAKGPGLIGAVLIGLNIAKSLAFALDKPFIGVNHIEAHLYGGLMSTETPVDFPCLGVVLSGGHTAIVLMHEIGHYTLIGQTVDDAIGEAFDKVAKMMGLPYPGGPPIEALAQEGDDSSYAFKAGKIKGRPLDFSFSGLKTAVLYALKKQPSLSHEDKKHVAASFQQAAFVDIVNKTITAAKKYSCQTVVFGGGVTNSRRLRELFSQQETSLRYIWPSSGLVLDNAAMIAGLGYHRYLMQGEGDSLSLEASSRLPRA